MNSLYAPRVIAKRHIFETLITPGFYIALSIGATAGFFAVRGFILSIDSNGFNPTLNPAFDLLGRFIAGLFGESFLKALFSEGPFRFALYAAFRPVILYLTVSSIIRTGLEKNVGALELILYGPADARDYLLGSLLRDILFSSLSLLFFLVFFAITALTNNLVLGPGFTGSLFVLFFASLLISAYGNFCAAATSTGSSGLALFIVIMAFFLFIQAGTFIIVSSYVKTLSSTISWAFRWISPFYYSGLCMRVLSDERPILFILLLLVFPLLSAVTVAASSEILKKRGVRS
jgi:hypothetical protein